MHPARLHRADPRRLLRRVRHRRDRDARPRTVGQPAVRLATSRSPPRPAGCSRPPSAPSAPAAGSLATRRARSGSQRLRAARLGAGLTIVPPAPPVDPVKAINPNPEVPEAKRTLLQVRQRDRAQPRRQARAHRGVLPPVRPGVLLHAQARSRATWSPGSTRWSAASPTAASAGSTSPRDRNVSNRWVVLKGLLNSGDPDALAAAIAEQQFLAQVEHPLIVEIYNFVTHEGAGYIVMEYVGGQSLKQILKERMRANGGAYDPLPVDQALAYVIEVLPAFQYLHDLGLVYCDFKPDNLIQVGDAMKLIDLGGVRRIDDDDSAIYGTVGYQAPEVAEVGPSVASDIYTIGRTLVVLCMEFRGYQGTYLHTLPPPESTPLFAEQRLALLADRQVLRRRPGRPVRLRRRAAHPAARRAARGSRRAHDRHRRSTSAASVLFEAPATSRVRARVVRSCPSCAPTPPTRSTPGSPASATTTPPQRLRCHLRGARRRRAEVLLARAHAALELGDADRRARGRRRAARPRTRGSGGRCGSTAWPPCRSGTGTPRRRRSTPSTSRCRASSPPSWRWRSPASGAACPRSPRGSTSPAPPPTRRTSPPRRSGWPGCAPSDATPRVPSRRSTGCRDQPRLPREPPAARRGAARPGLPRPRRARPGDALHRVGVDGPRHPGRYTVRILEQALGDRDRPAGGASRRHRSAATRPTRPDCATGSSGATALLARDAQRSPSGSSWSTRPTPYGAGA